jgi:hypothetical protein
MTRLLAVFSLVSTLGFAETWSGALVDAGCYTREEQNVTNKGDVETNHDRSFEIRQCSPGAKTMKFAVVDRDGQSFKLDAAGNAKAARLVSEQHVKGWLDVTVSGRKSGGTVMADSISAYR